MFDLSWAHIAVIATVAIVVIGPKDLPVALRTVGKFVAKAKAMAREFQTNVDDMIRESELDEIKKQVENVQSGNIERAIESTVDPKGDLAKAFEPPEFSLEDKPDEPPPIDPTTPAVAPTPVAAAVPEPANAGDGQLARPPAA